MIAEISTAVLDKLHAAGLDVSQIDFRDLVSRTTKNLIRPAVNINIDSATKSKVTLTTDKVNLNISLILVMQNLRDESFRKVGVYRLIQGVIDTLTHQDLGLDLQDHMRFTSFRNLTDKAYQDAGYIIYQVMFSCSYNVTYDDPLEKDLGFLESIWCEYYLQHPADRGTTGQYNAADLFTLETGSSG